jgi:PAS domain S-box-containing protein
MPQIPVPADPVREDIGRTAEARLRVGEQRLKLALEAAHMGSWELDLETMELTTSAQCKANHGLGPDDELTLSAGVIATIDEDHRPRFLAAFDHAIATGETIEMEVPNRWPDGSHHWLLIRGCVVEPGCMAGVTADVTQRHATEQALRESEKRFRALADNIAQLAWMADARGSIFWYNRRWFEYTGTTLLEMQGWGWQKVHHPDYVAGVVERIGRCFATGETWDDTFPLRSKEGEYRWFLSHAAPIRDESGCVTLWFGSNTDITDQRRAEETLRDADRRKDEFLAVLAHEMRGPLSPIMNAARILQTVGPQDPVLAKQRETILRQAGQLAALVNDLLDAGRIATGKLRVERRRVDLNVVLKQAAETSAPLVERRRHTLRVDFVDHPVYIDADQGRLVQVLSNLLNNAAKYQGEGGRIAMAALEQMGMAVIRVQDEGMGIPPAMLGRVFDRFVQVDSSRHRADGGLGIGLSLVKALVEQHGGTVEARSEGLGRGSEFIVRLPVMAGPDPH